MDSKDTKDIRDTKDTKDISKDTKHAKEAKATGSKRAQAGQRQRGRGGHHGVLVSRVVTKTPDWPFERFDDGRRWKCWQACETVETGRKPA